MLELLSGPHSLLDLNAVAVADDGLQQCRQWDDDVGLIFSEGRTLKKSWLIQLDGTACLRGFMRITADFHFLHSVTF